jgi:hypothetical protein
MSLVGLISSKFDFLIGVDILPKVK